MATALSSSPLPANRRTGPPKPGDGKNPVPTGDLTGVTTLPYGRFLPEPASYELLTPNLPSNWNYIYQNRKMLLRVDQFGLAYAQAFPPHDIVMLARDRYQRSSPWLCWINSTAFARGAFSNFFRPNLRADDPSYVPAGYSVKFTPSRAIYRFIEEGVDCQTEVFLPPDQPALAVRMTLRNTTPDRLPLTVHSIMHHACRWGRMAAWDKPEWYTETGFFHAPQEELAGFGIQLRSPTCDPAKRRAALFESSADGLQSAGVSYEKFIGSGTFERPDLIHRGALELSLEDDHPWLGQREESRLFAYPQSGNLHFEKTLEPRESWSINQTYTWLDTAGASTLPPRDRIRPQRIALTSDAFDDYLAAVDASHQHWFGQRTLTSPDPALDAYANSWLPLQLNWACSLDRGWPHGMRGGRDAANDFTALAPIDPDYTRQLILTELSCQEPDGRIPRNFSARGHAGAERDTRPTVDAGAVFCELIHAYLGHTHDYDLMKERVPWLNRPVDETSSVLDHVIRIADYYLAAENIGEHGLVKLREGGWMDAINHAGLKGRGECVTTTFQVAHALRLLEDILRALSERGLTYQSLVEINLARLRRGQANFIRQGREHGLNPSGYFNGIFNDDGVWFFTDQDPDGQRRIFAPATYWAIIAGALDPDETRRALGILEELKCSAGYHLQWPGFEQQTFPHIGRMASGDSPSGRSEHANPYNHGSHGFLGRALAVAGEGDLLLDALHSLLPYDQEKHPTARTMTPPYAVVNVWERIPGFPFRGKDSFLTGSTAYGMRLVYDWMVGLKPTFAGIKIDPCLPRHFDQLTVRFHWLQREIELHLENPDAVATGIRRVTVDGRALRNRSTDIESGRECAIVAPNDLKKKSVNRISVVLG